MPPPAPLCVSGVKSLDRKQILISFGSPMRPVVRSAKDMPGRPGKLHIWFWSPSSQNTSRERRRSRAIGPPRGSKHVLIGEMLGNRRRGRSPGVGIQMHVGRAAIVGRPTRGRFSDAESAPKKPGLRDQRQNWEMLVRTRLLQMWA